MSYRVVARNFSQTHDNKIHSDEVAKKYGFLGALVPGVAVFGHLVHPLVAAHSEQWLGQSVSRVRFAKPAYDGDPLTIEHEPVAVPAQAQAWPDIALGEQCIAQARDETIATLDSTVPASPPSVREVRWNDLPQKPPGRPEMAWDNVVPNQSLSPWEWHLDAESNRQAAAEVADDNPLYNRYLHPHLLLSSANRALTREYQMPAWIHVGSELCLHHEREVGDDVLVRGIPLEKWERKGHQFVSLYLRYQRGEEVAAEILHTAIFRIAP